MGGYWLVFENVSASKCALSCFSAAHTPIRACLLILATQCDLCRPTGSGTWARSNLKRRCELRTVSGIGDQVRPRTHATFQTVPLEQNYFKTSSRVALRCSGRCAGATDRQPDDAPPLRWLSCARLRWRVNPAPAGPARPGAFAPADTAAGTPKVFGAGALHQSGSYPRIPALGHAAWQALAATGAFTRTKSRVRTDGATIVEPMPSANLAREHDAGELTHSPRQDRGSARFQFTC